jgi:tetratricopeptide (TPR) repeat protein
MDSQGRFGKAIMYYDKVLAIDPNDVLALINKGRALSQLHRFDDAISNYDKALGIDASNIDALINKGLSYYNQGNKTGAISYFDKALAINPSDQLAQGLKQRAELDIKTSPSP